VATYEGTLRSLRVQMREAVSRAAKESAKWNSAKSLLETEAGSSPAQLRIAANNSLAMKDAMAGCRFHTEVATMYANVLMAEILAQETLGQSAAKK
jgi:hypothetical protein